MSALARTAGDDDLTGETVVGPEIAIRGRIEGEEDLRVEGRVEGSVSLTETLYVEPEGVVLAQIEARDVVISGIVIGDIAAANSVTLNRNAKLVGNISAPRVIIADGASFRGDVVMDHEDFQQPVRERTRARETVPRTSVGSTGRSTARRATAVSPTRRETPVPAAAHREVAPRRAERAVESPSSRTVPSPSRRGSDDDDVTVVIKHAALRKGEAPPEEEDKEPKRRRRRAKKSARMPARGRSKAGRRKS